MTGDGDILDLRPKGGALAEAVGWVRNLFSSRQAEESYEGWMTAGRAEGALGLGTPQIEQLIMDGKLRSRRVGDTVLVLREDVQREAKARIIGIMASTEGSESGATSISTDAPKVGPPIVVVESPKHPEQIIERAVMR